MDLPTLFLHARDTGMAAAWRRAFADVAAAEVVEADILAGQADAVVSPANSFGMMDGGLDLAYLQCFGLALQDDVQARIARDFYGELPVGQATVVATRHPGIPFLVVAPTMRVPARIPDTVNVYLAFRAALLAVHLHNALGHAPIRTLRVPALGTGVGGMPPERAARQMRAAVATLVDRGERIANADALQSSHARLLT